MHTKLKSLSFSRVSVGMLGAFFGFLCYVFRTTLVVFCCCECVTKLCSSLCLAGSLAARCGKHAKKKLKRLSFISFSWVSEGALDTFLRLRFRNEIRWYFAVANASQSHAACAWQARWLQNVLNMRRVSEETLGTFLEFFAICFGNEIRWCFAAANASQNHVACA